MKRVYFFTILILALTACQSEKKRESDSDIDAARNFIQAALKGKYDMARQYMLQDPVNEERLDAVSRVQLSPEEKQGLWEASITIHSRHLLGDTASIIIFSNSYHKENRDTLKLVKNEGLWLVDFKYLFDPQ
ncbi:nuclear transport factor 2 family protein [Niabella terrae]